MDPLLTTRLRPVREEFLGLRVSLHENRVLVKLQVVHSLEANVNRLYAVELGDAERLRPVRVSCRPLPRDERATGLEKSF